MTAAEIAAALGDARREGFGWRCRCPLHGGRSLTLRDGQNGRILVTCWGGCDRLEVLAELRRCGFLHGAAASCRPRPVNQSVSDDNSRIAKALAIWRDAHPAAGTIVARYLASRGIMLDFYPGSLRFHPRCPRPNDASGNAVPPLPAMVSLVEHAERGQVAVHCTYLRSDGSAKADPPEGQQRAVFGPVGGGAARFGTLSAAGLLAVSEGIETGLSIAMACAWPVWVALSAGGIKKLVLPLEATQIVICSDHDANGIGQRASNFAAHRFVAEGRRVRIAMPPKSGSDFNDVLNLNARFREANDVA